MADISLGNGEADGLGYTRFTIKSFKHDGSVHRVWLENWLVPEQKLAPEHASEEMMVLLNEHTLIREADGKEWISRAPAVSFFLPNIWFNVVALLEEKGIRYYCNIASPPYRYRDILTYIDYDLDVVVLPDGTVHQLDKEEFVRHATEYKYGEAVVRQVEEGLSHLLARIEQKASPFNDEAVLRYYEGWKAGTRA